MKSGGAVLALAVALGAAGSAVADAMLSGQAEVVDGDGLRIGMIAIHLHGVDAPELGQRRGRAGGGTWPCDEAAAERLEALIGQGEVACEPLDRDGYGSVIAGCRAGGVDLAETLVSEGLVWAFLRFSTDYAAEEAEARAAGRGVWQAPTEAPWDYRSNRWERAAEVSPRPGCPIKGDISAEGERIYPTPWSPWYGRTKIDEAKGETWFRGEAEPLAAGWRPARFR